MNGLIELNDISCKICYIKTDRECRIYDRANSFINLNNVTMMIHHKNLIIVELSNGNTLKLEFITFEERIKCSDKIKEAMALISNK